MSQSDNDSIQSAESLSDELFTCCCTSGTFSEEGLREIIEHGLTPNSNHLSNYQFFRAACCNKNVTEGIIQSLLEYFPDAASDTDENGLLALHCACLNKNMTLNIVQLLVDAAPDSVRREDNDGMMPLHFLCSNREVDEIRASEILKLLLEKYPESIRHQNNNGLLPIHAASMMSRSPEFCRLLVAAYPGSERIADAGGALPFHSACMNNVVATVEYLYKLYPDAINHTTPNNGMYPIHAAMLSLDCRLEPKMAAVEIVEFLLGCDPNVKYQEVRQGQSLLHLACQCYYNDASIEAALGIIKVLYDAHPDFIHKEDGEGNLPLHKLCTNDCEAAAMEILKLLLEKHPESIRHQNVKGNLPIHIASMMSRSPEFCCALIKAYPGSERIDNLIGMLPIHYACMHNAVATVEYLYTLYPDGINHATRQGLYPIHTAISSMVQNDEENWRVVDIVKFLLGDPRVKFQKLQVLERVSLFAWAYFLQYNDANIEVALEVIKAIYDAHPEAIETDIIASNIYNRHPQVQVFINRQLVYSRQARDHRQMTTPDGNGQLPLHTALQSNATLGSIKLLVKGNPPAVQSPDNSGSLPLHIACEHHDSPSVVQSWSDLIQTQ